MNRTQRRVHKRRIRRIGVMLASITMLATTTGLGGVAFANGGGKGFQCDPGPNTVGKDASANRNYEIGRAGNACD